MWRVDLGIRVWVVSVGIRPGRRLPNVDIRIGDEERVAFESNPLCRQGLEIINTVFLRYDCAEPMLGKYVYISLNYKEAATLELCDVQVFMNEGSVFDELIYRFLDFSQFVQGNLHSSLGSDRFVLQILNSGFMHKREVHRKDIIIDLPPKIEMLKRNVAILIPFNRSFEHYRKDTCTLNVFFDHYINGTVLGYSEVKGTVSVKSVYYRDNEKKTRERVFHCNIRDVRIRGANICDLQNKCGASVGSHCDKTFISPLLPPGGYHCKCNVGFVPSPSSKLGMDNHVNPGERCIRKPKGTIQHSNQNLALTMKVTACSTDNFDGCKKEAGCKEVFAFRRFVVDGILKTCFLSLNENKPWLIVHLDDYRPVSYVRVAASPKFPSDRLIVSVGKLTHFKMCAFRRVLEKGQQLSFGCNDYLFGNAVQITTNSRILSLCEIEVYSYSYANVALQPTSKLKKSFMNDGNLKSCFTKTGTVWSLDLGNNVRVAVVFILHGRSTYLEGSEITVGYSIKKEICTTIPKYEELGNYFECQKPVIGNSLEVELKSRRTFEICEVEVFQTKTGKMHNF
ncbi:unnamed protein product [Pocillopora meandrina]|uniref:Uncharacterized protein n=1 Tax=Pocillopora meandrina TaxID=46732 RepID=A0AAU9VSD7_9CNID|nr:unnamed protein product [Pocillopora meandrina]